MIVPRLNLLPVQFRPRIHVNPHGGDFTFFPAISRFMSRVNKLGPLWKGTCCWLWTGGIHEFGYGQFEYNSKTWQAHVWYWEFTHGPVLDGRELDHLCRTRNCVNPLHMEPVTHKTNLMRGNGPTAINARKTHCVHGHALEGDNVYIATKGRRQCRLCHRKASQRYDKHRRLRLKIPPT